MSSFGTAAGEGKPPDQKGGQDANVLDSHTLQSDSPEAEKLRAMVAKMTSDESHFSIVALLATRELFPAAQRGLVQQIDITDLLPDRFSSTRLSFRLRELIEEGIVCRLRTGGYALTAEAQLITEKELAPKVTDRVEELRREAQEHQALSPDEKAEKALKKNPRLVPYLMELVPQADADTKGRVRVNPILMNMRDIEGMTRSKVTSALNALKAFGFISSLDQPTDVARECYRRRTESKQPVPVVASVRESKAPPKKIRRVAPIEHFIDRSLDDEGSAPKIPSKVEKSKSPSKPIERKEPAKKKSEPVRSRKEEAPVVATLPEPKSKPVSAPTIERLTAKQATAAVSAVLKDNSLTAGRGEPTFQVSSHGIQVSFKTMHSPLYNLLTHLARHSERLPLSRSIKSDPEFASSNRYEPSSSQREILSTLSHYPLPKNVPPTSFWQMLIDYRDSLGQCLAARSVMRDPAVTTPGTDISKSDLVERYYAIFGLMRDQSIDELARQARSTHISDGARVVKELISGTDERMYTTLNAALIFRKDACGDAAISAVHAAEKTVRLLGLSGNGISLLNDVDGAMPRLLSGKNFGLLLEKDKTLFESRSIPGTGLLIVRSNDGDIQIKGLCISENSSTENILRLILEFEELREQLQLPRCRVGIAAGGLSHSFASGVEIVSTLKMPANGLGEVWVTNGTVTGQREIQGANFVAKFRFRNNGQLIELYNYITDCSENSMNRFDSLRKEVAEFNRQVLFTSLREHPHYHLEIGSELAEFGGQLPQVVGDQAEAMLRWLDTLSFVLESGELQPEYFQALAHHPDPDSGFSLLHAARQLSSLEQQLNARFKSTPLTLRSISAEVGSFGLTFESVEQFHEPDVRIDAKIMTGPVVPEASAIVTDNKRRFIRMPREFSLLYLASELAKYERIPDEFWRYHYDSAQLDFLKERGLIDADVERRSALRCRERLQSHGVFSMPVIDSLETFNWMDLEAAIRAGEVFGRHVTWPQVQLIENLLRVSFSEGFVPGNFGYLDHALDGSLRTKLHAAGKRAALSTAIFPIENVDTIVIADRIGSHTAGNAGEMCHALRGATYAIEVTWSKSSNQLFPEVRSIYITSQANVEEIRLVLRGINEVTRGTANASSASLNLLLGNRLKLMEGHHTTLDIHAGDILSADFNPRLSVSSGLWITDGMISYQPRDGQGPTVGVRGHSFMMLVVPVRHSSHVRLDRVLLRGEFGKPSLSQQNQARIRSIVRNIFEYNAQRDVSTASSGDCQ